jgi:hypothetical protein
MFEFLTKINIIINLIKFFKDQKLFTFLFFLFLISTSAFIFGFLKYNDNSIHIDNIEDDKIKENVIKILTKCGDKNAIGLSTISTEIKTDYYAKFKEIYSCDFLLNPKNCIVDLSSERFPFAGDYSVDNATYSWMETLAKQEDVEKVYLPEFELENYPTIESLLLKSVHFKDGSAKHLFITAVKNETQHLIYAIHMVSWNQQPCSDAKYLLNKFRKKLPIKK